VMGFAAINVVWLFVWQMFASRMVGYRLLTMLRDIVPFMLISLAVMVVTYWATRAIGDLRLLLVARILVAALLYGLTMKLSRARIFEECIDFIRNRNKKH